MVDDFGVKYVGEEHAQHLLDVVRQHYKVTDDLGKDTQGSKFIGITLEWDYPARRVHLSMPGYVQEALIRFKKEQPHKPQEQPHKHVSPAFGKAQQYIEDAPESVPATAEEKTYIQQVVGTFLYYARAVDPTMLVALSAIAADQAAPTKTTLEKVEQLLDYAASQEDAVITYHSSDMVLAIHSDASYLSESKARSRAGGHFFMSSDRQMPPNNGPVLTLCQIIRAVMSSACEAEIGAMYMNAREAVPARKTLEEMGHPQPRTPMQTDNSAAHSVVTNNIQPRRTKAMDMRFYWLRCRDAQGQFRYYWMPGTQNLADYFTKHFPGAHHKAMRPQFLTPKKHLESLRRRKLVARQRVELAQALTELASRTQFL